MAKKGDMLYAWTNDAEIKKKAELGGAVTALWKHALESKVVDAVLAIKKGKDLYDAQPVLIKNPNDLSQTAGSLHCGTLLLPKLVKKYLDGAANMKIGVTVKGCDVMGFIELANRKQINLPPPLVMVRATSHDLIALQAFDGTNTVKELLLIPTGNFPMGLNEIIKRVHQTSTGSI